MQAVFTPDRTTKLRLVFDASAKGKNGKSLHDHLEKGPNSINSLPKVLMAWRFDQVANTGDMRKMFNQVRIHPDDQVFHRFLWRTNDSEQPRVLWVRLNFGDKPAPDIAAATIKESKTLPWPKLQKPSTWTQLKSSANVSMRTTSVAHSKENKAQENDEWNRGHTCNRPISNQSTALQE